MKKIIDNLYKSGWEQPDNILKLIRSKDEEVNEYLYKMALRKKREIYGENIFIRGLIEYSNICKRSCKYCGIRAENKLADRYRLAEDDIYGCIDDGYKLGFRTFVLQGGEDGYFSADKLSEIVKTIKDKYPKIAITLSAGEYSYDEYKKMKNSGTDRYLLRHETKSKHLYESVHPNMSYENRERCLRNMKEIGFQIGTGFIVGLPNCTDEYYLLDLDFIRKFQPHMVGIGPFMPQKNTPFFDVAKGELTKTLNLMALSRLIAPKALIPSTTALSTLVKDGRKLGILAGANVIMLNLSPPSAREKYSLYDGKNNDNSDNLITLQTAVKEIEGVGYNALVGSRGDHSDYGE